MMMMMMMMMNRGFDMQMADNHKRPMVDCVVETSANWSGPYKKVHKLSMGICSSHNWSDCPSFLNAFAKLRKATISFVMSVCPSLYLFVRMEQLSSLCREFGKIWYRIYFPKSVEKIQVSLKSNKNNGYFTWRRFHIYHNISLNFSENEKYFR
jgi:hypothetical protein